MKPPYLHSQKYLVDDEIRPYQGKDISFHGEMLVQLCLLASAILEGREDREDILNYRDPRVPESEALWMALIKKHRRKLEIE